MDNTLFSALSYLRNDWIERVLEDYEQERKYLFVWIDLFCYLLGLLYKLWAYRVNNLLKAGKFQRYLDQFENST